MRNKKRSRGREMLISLAITVGLLLVIIGLTFWYQWYSGTAFDFMTLLITDSVGFLIMYGIVYHFVKTPDDNEDNWK